jgi:hypothetical protein
MGRLAEEQSGAPIGDRPKPIHGCLSAVSWRQPIGPSGFSNFPALAWACRSLRAGDADQKYPHLSNTFGRQLRSGLKNGHIRGFLFDLQANFP